ncbi:MAG: DUF4923 family protein [Bacteroidales bacterium]
MKSHYLLAGTFLLFFSCFDSVQAQSLKKLLNSSSVQNAVTAVTGGQNLSVRALTGTWTYVTPSVELKSDNALSNIAGSVASEELEKKMKDLCSKIGVEPGLFNYTFHADSTFTSVVKGKTLKGTYQPNPEAKTIELHFGRFGDYKLTTMTAHATLSANQLSLLFEADKLLDFLSTLGTLSNNNSLQLVSQLAQQYDGMRLGFELKK